MSPVITHLEMNGINYAWLDIVRCLVIVSLFNRKYLKQESGDKKGQKFDTSEWVLKSKRPNVSFPT